MISPVRDIIFNNNVILIHGFDAKKEVWIGLFGPLSEKFKIIRFDNRSAVNYDQFLLILYLIYILSYFRL